MEAEELSIEVANVASQDMETHHGAHRGLAAVPNLHVGAMIYATTTHCTSWGHTGGMAWHPCDSRMLRDATFHLSHGSMRKQGTAVGPCHSPCPAACH